MSHPIDVGSVLGGRYKVTATVLTSHDHDLVLDGVDQVLNRPVSILVAGPDNAEQVAQSAREVAVGERPGNVQILDLGVSDSTTYLITNHTSAADLLDLVVASNPPYVEPFFTDTLGSEIFGHARSHEPETYDDEEEVDAGYINYGNNRAVGQDRKQSSAPVVPPVVPPRTAPVRPPSSPAAGSAGADRGARGTGASAAGAAGAAGLAAGAAGAAGGAAAASKSSKEPTTAPQATTPQQAVPESTQNTEAIKAQAPAAESPKVSLWANDDYDHRGDDATPSTGPARTARESMGAPFPAFAGGGRGDETDEYYDDDEPPEREPRSMRWLVGGLLAAVLVVGLIFAVSNLGSLFKSQTQSNPVPGNSSSAAQPQASGAPSPTGSAAPVAGPPAVEGVSRLGNFDFAATYDGDLSKTFDANAASYWSDMEFATDNWGGLAPDVSLVVKLKDPSKVSSITLSQLGGSGGNISVLTNDRPSLDGAKQVGSNSFTSPDLTMPLPEPVTAQYVIVSIKNLPKLAAPKTRFGYGLRLADIKVQ
ncbi:ABC transporter substrate-binding protein [Arthrobacter sp. ISL-72]|uniref:ABC transporter substrate-binding protein n=1 Tax=Arthrobacter sp. ISL-72 TaxID=2819114 RepID=UPI001BEC9430|nr:ABC transporter substrate-binding protein [Arthrobacter sp. ISL-72]MBT2597302.1 ABC transporter substrate-binding protein [Arthrobacter sp. ISL-72]